MLCIYRKITPAINRSVYAAGSELRTFHIDGLNFGVLICFDSNFPDLARQLLTDRGLSPFAEHL